MEQGLEVQRRNGGFLGEILVEMGFITAAQLGRILEEIYGVPYVDLSATRIDPAVVSAPLITTLVDGTGLIIYFEIAKVLLRI